MSALNREIDLSQFGCPLHYIKAREAIKEIKQGDALVFIINNGDAVTEVMDSLRQDGHFCEIEQNDELTTKVKVKKNDGH